MNDDSKIDKLLIKENETKNKVNKSEFENLDIKLLDEEIKESNLMNLEIFDETLEKIDLSLKALTGKLNENNNNLKKIKPEIKKIPIPTNIEDNNDEHEIRENYLSVEGDDNFKEVFKKNKNNYFLICLYIFLSIIIFFILHKFLDSSKGMLVLKIPESELYLNKYFEIINNIKYVFLDLLNYVNYLQNKWNN